MKGGLLYDLSQCVEVLHSVDIRIVNMEFGAMVDITDILVIELYLLLFFYFIFNNCSINVNYEFFP